MRVLVTGSRQFMARSLVYSELDAAWQRSITAGEAEFVVVHGNAPGADTLANDWVWDHRASPFAPLAEPHPVNWRPLGYYDATAGRQRNIRMLQSHPDLILAFFANGARNAGTRHCVESAKVFAPDVELKEFWA